MPIIYIAYLSFAREEMLIWRGCTVGSKVHFKFTGKKKTQEKRDNES